MEENKQNTELQQEVPHKRRKRYSGTHPKKFSEKYKELNPEKYKEDVAHIIARGATPAGMHISIMVQEILDFLNIQPGQIGLDATLGYGGHTKAMLEKLEGKGHIYGLDVDPIESEKTKKRLADAGFGEDILTVRLQNFKDIDKVSEETGHKFNFILADLGVSSMQIDNPERGFSYKVDGPLDLRLNPQKGVSGADRLKQLTKAEIEGMLIENADEPYAQKIANAICRWRNQKRPIETTTDLRKCITEALSFLPEKEQKEAIKKSCQRTFQAIRIDINSEFEVLYEFLEKLPSVLAPGGRAAVLTFHSGEDRLVKKAFKEYHRQGVFSDVARDVIRPTQEECFKNSRAKSTKMRWAVK
ncbi:MAG: 16S rRNA (cytosine(1402)-N(4))-methyltransferase RsmH [Ruminococcaceae bacterium]|nr:16S rRNA (cytosine(1402)-N(4))-methyltransferase RsmH [Oscillospiraceae bacterium]